MLEESKSGTNLNSVFSVTNLNTVAHRPSITFSGYSQIFGATPVRTFPHNCSWTRVYGTRSTFNSRYKHEMYAEIRLKPVNSSIF